MVQCSATVVTWKRQKTNCDSIKETVQLICVGTERAYSCPYHILFGKHVKAVCLEFSAKKTHYFLIFHTILIIFVNNNVKKLFSVIVHNVDKYLQIIIF
jgi:hypothetical protein